LIVGVKGRGRNRGSSHEYALPDRPNHMQGTIVVVGAGLALPKDGRSKQRPYGFKAGETKSKSKCEVVPPRPELLNNPRWRPVTFETAVLSAEKP